MYFDSILPPNLMFTNNTLELIMSYHESKKNKLKIEVKTDEKEIILSAKSLLRSYSSTKRIVDLKRYKITDLTQFKVYWLDPDNKKHLLMVYSDTKPYYTSTIFPFREGNKWCYVDSNFNKLSDYFDFVFPFNGNYGVVKINNKLALINKSMTLLTQAVFEEIDYKNYRTQRNPPTFSVQKNGKHFIVDSTGQRTIDDSQSLLTCGGGGGYPFGTVNSYSLKGKMGLISTEPTIGRNELSYDTITPAIYDAISTVSSEGEDYYWLVKIDKKYGIIEKKGREKLPIIYDEIRMNRYNERWYDPNKEMLVCVNNKCGFVDVIFNFFTELKYSDALPFNLGFSLVETPGGEWGYIDRKGREYWR
jgi:hypothetical protein